MMAESGFWARFLQGPYLYPERDNRGDVEDPETWDDMTDRQAKRAFFQKLGFSGWGEGGHR